MNIITKKSALHHKFAKRIKYFFEYFLIFLQKSLDICPTKEYNISTVKGNRDELGGKCRKGKAMSKDMTRLELLTVMLSIKALLESNNVDKAKELIDEVISEAKRKSSDI